MSATRPGAIFRQLQPADLDDGPLLARFAGRRDPAAFAALVRRHGPMVLAVCRRVTGNLPDAEDAFQAAFLVLARSAGSVRKPERLGSWLYGVAVKVAGRARRTAMRRRRRETTVAAFPDVPAPEPSPHDVGPALHEELAALPAHHREAIVLCDLQGLSRADAAKALGVAEGTLSSRLANGRKRLAERLTRRGVTLGAVALPGVLADGRAAVPDELVTNTCGLAAAWAAGGPLPAAVVRLARGGFSMRGVLLGGVLTLTLAAGAALAAGFGDAPPPADPPPAAPVAQPEAKAQPKKDAKEAEERPGAPRLRHWSDLNIRLPRNVAWSADGKLLAIQGQRPDNDAAGAMAKLAAGASDFLVVPTDFPDAAGAAYHLPARGSVVGFLPGGKQLLTVVRESGLISGASSFQVWNWVRLSPEGGPTVSEYRRGGSVPIPEDAYQFTPATDGKTIRYLVVESGTPVPQFSIGAGTLHEKGFDDGKRSGPVTGPFRAIMFTPDAARVVALTDAGAVEAYGLDGKRQWTAEPPAGSKTPFWAEGGPSLYPSLAAARDGSRVLAVRSYAPPVVYDAATGKARPALEGAEPSERGSRMHAAVSADGRLAALLYTPAVPRPDPFGKGAFAGNPQPKGVPGGGRGFLGKGEPRLAVWDTETGRLVRSWRGDALALSFHPTQPRLAILEANSGQTRLGLWDFLTEVVEE